MKTFKVGDRVRGKGDEDYYVTTSLADLIVTKILTKDLIQVRLVGHKVDKFKDRFGEEFQVEKRYFVKLGTFKGNIK